MIKFENTENLAGVSITGDYYDFNNLVDAFHNITVDEYSEKNSEYAEMSIRVLGVCYDIRHAYQGDREVVLLDNEMDDEKMKYHSILTTSKNVYYKCNLLYPEMLYVTIALNELVILRMKELSKKKNAYEIAFDKNVVWDETIAAIRNFQAEFAKCVKELLTERSFSMWCKYMNDAYYIFAMYHQYLDLLNIQYLNMTKEKRLKNFTKISKRIADYFYDDEYRSMKKAIDEAAKKHNCHSSELRLVDKDYPEQIVW